MYQPHFCKTLTKKEKTMHIKLSNENSIVKAFRQKRKELGFTTDTSAMVKAMKLFIEQDTPPYLERKPNE